MPSNILASNGSDEQVSGLPQELQLNKHRSDANCDRDSITVITRSPSPFDDIGTPTEAAVQGIMEQLTNGHGSGSSIPSMPPSASLSSSGTSKSDGVVNHQPQPAAPSQRRSGGGGRSLRKRSSNLIKSFTGGAMGARRVNSLVSSTSSIDEGDIHCGGGGGGGGHSLSVSSENLDRLIGELGTSTGHGSGGGADGHGDDATSDGDTSCAHSTAGSNSQLDVELPPSNSRAASAKAPADGGTTKLSKKWQPRKASSRLKNGLAKSFSRMGAGVASSKMANHSSHPNSDLTDLIEEPAFRRNSDDDCGLTELIRNTSGDAMASTRDVARMLQQDICADFDSDDEESIGGGGKGFGGAAHKFMTQHSRQLSTFSTSSDLNNDDSIDNLFLDSRAMLESLGDSPTSHELANVAAVRAKEYIEECFNTEHYSVEGNILDRKKWDAIPQFTKSDLVVGQHLGKGSFSDAFEVFATVVEEDSSPTLESLGSDRKDLDKLIERRFNKRPSIISEGDDDESMGRRRSSACEESAKEVEKIEKDNKEVEKKDGDQDELDGEIDAMFGKKEDKVASESRRFKRPSVVMETDESRRSSNFSGSGDELDEEIDRLFGNNMKEDKKDESGDELDKEIDAMFGAGDKKKEESGDELDEEIDTMFGGGDKKKEESGDELDKEIDAMFGKPALKKENAQDLKALNVDAVGAAMKKDNFVPQRLPPPRKSSQRRATTDLGGSFCVSGLSSHRAGLVAKSHKTKERKVVLAMKCLRPQIRSNADQFIIGVEDLVHETAMLASLDHPNIVKIHGRAGGCISNSFRLSDGFFILLDRLKDTLDDRIVRWKKINKDKRAPPSLAQIKAAVSIADAMSYLHSKKIVFRDLKPPNVGFDPSGTLKLFDFGFAIGVEEPLHTPSMCGDDSEEEYDGLLYDKCGTPRYMAPEVGLEKGYSLPADVYSFGILLWEICSLKKPFANVRSADEFHKTVFEKGARPKVGKYWPEVLKETIVGCWDEDPEARPDMRYVKSMLSAHARELLIKQQNGGDQNNLRKSSVFRRFTG